MERKSAGRGRRVDSGGGRGGGVVREVHSVVMQVVRRWIVAWPGRERDEAVRTAGPEKSVLEREVRAERKVEVERVEGRVKFVVEICLWEGC